MEEATGDTENGTYMISIKAVSPSEPSDEEKRSALYSIGLEEMNDKISTIEPFEMAKILNEYGTGAVLFSDNGDNARELFKIAREECEKITTLFGFYMDRQLNMIGNSGWDFIKGEIGFKNDN
jgi:hypothetical protein